MPALTKELVPILVATGAPARMAEPAPPRFRVGEAVIARNVHPLGHSRIPRYIKGRRGVVDRDHGVFFFPDAAAGGQGHVPQHCYSVRFMARELWGEQASPLDSIQIDLFDEYMDPDPAAGAAAAPESGVARPQGGRPRRSAQPQRNARSKPRKARRPGVRLKKSEKAKPASSARKTRSASSKKRAAPAKARKAVAKPARGRKSAKKARAARS